jgi:hypothetical protein
LLFAFVGSAAMAVGMRLWIDRFDARWLFLVVGGLCM